MEIVWFLTKGGGPPPLPLLRFDTFPFFSQKFFIALAPDFYRTFSMSLLPPSKLRRFDGSVLLRSSHIRVQLWFKFLWVGFFLFLCLEFRSYFASVKDWKYLEMVTFWYYHWNCNLSAQTGLNGEKYGKKCLRPK